MIAKWQEEERKLANKNPCWGYSPPDVDDDDDACYSCARSERVYHEITGFIYLSCRSQWPRGLRRRSTAVRLLRSWVRIPPGAWKFVCYECCVLSDRGLCDELITRPEESYRLWCVVVCDLETIKILVNEEEAKTHLGAIAPREKKLFILVSPIPYFRWTSSPDQT